MKYLDIILVGVLFWLCFAYLVLKIYTIYSKEVVYENGIYDGSGTITSESVFTLPEDNGSEGDVLIYKEGELKWKTLDENVDTNSIYNSDGVLEGDNLGNHVAKQKLNVRSE